MNTSKNFVPRLDLVIDYQPSIHGNAATLYSTLKTEIGTLCKRSGLTEVKLGLARADTDTKGIPTGKIRIPLELNDPTVPASVLDTLRESIIGSPSAIAKLVGAERNVA